MMQCKVKMFFSFSKTIQFFCGLYCRSLQLWRKSPKYWKVSIRKYFKSKYIDKFFLSRRSGWKSWLWNLYWLKKQTSCNFPNCIRHHVKSSCYHTAPSAIWEVFSNFLKFRDLFHERFKVKTWKLKKHW